MTTDSKPRIGIVTISDRASTGVYEDLSGPAIRETLRSFLASPWEEVYRLIPDDQPTIEATLRALCDDEGCCMVLTTGGTGPGPRDVTPEATRAVCPRILEGFGERMRSVSLQYVPTAILSRQLAGLRGSALVVNLPGRPRSIRECLEGVFPAIPYCLELAGGPVLLTDEAVVKAFRPQK
jgi:molybdopterin adenylyltransferase